MDRERIQQLVDDALRPSGAWYAIAPDTWASACKSLLSDLERTQEELMREQEENDALRTNIAALIQVVEALRGDTDIPEPFDGMLPG